jgi:hypothetical protein
MGLWSASVLIILFLAEGQVTAVSSPANDSLAAKIDRLRTIPAVEPNIYGFIPEDARTLLIDFKREVGLTVARSIETLDPGKAADGVRSEVIAALRRRGVAVGQEPDYQKELGYGYVPQVQVRTLPGPGSMLGVTVEFSIPCSGFDTTLYIFRYSGGSWSQVLVQDRSEFGGDIAGGQGAFAYRTSSPDAMGSVLVFTAFVLPHCTSVWHPVLYSLYRIPSALSKAVLIASGTTDAIALDEGYQITTERSGFALSYVTSGVEEPGDRFREVLHFRVKGNQVESSRSRPGG